MAPGRLAGTPPAAAPPGVEAGGRVVLGPSPGGSYVENVATGEQMGLRKDCGVYAIDVCYEAGDGGIIVLDSGAGVGVWPKAITQDA